jgi:hypothetical protein
VKHRAEHQIVGPGKQPVRLERVLQVHAPLLASGTKLESPSCPAASYA